VTRSERIVVYTFAAILGGLVGWALWSIVEVGL